MPVVWNSGLNSGVLFMRLDRMREFEFERKVEDLLSNNVSLVSKIIYPEQDILNIIFYTNIGEFMKKII